MIIKMKAVIVQKNKTVNYVFGKKLSLEAEADLFQVKDNSRVVFLCELKKVDHAYTTSADSRIDPIFSPAFNEKMQKDYETIPLHDCIKVKIFKEDGNELVKYCNSFEFEKDTVSNHIRLDHQPNMDCTRDIVKLSVESLYGR